MDLRDLVQAATSPAMSLATLLPLCRDSLHDADPRVRLFTVDALCFKSVQATSAQWAAFVSQVAFDQKNDEYIYRVACVGRLGKRFPSGKEQTDALESILWLIANYPESRVHVHYHGHSSSWLDQEACNVISEAWRKALANNPQQVTVISNAVHFFTARDPTFAEALLLKCIDLEPDSERWRRRIEKLRGSSGDREFRGHDT